MARSADDILEALSGARTAMSVLDRDGRYLFVNRALGELLGAAPEELCGTRYRERGGGVDGDAFDRSFRAAVAEGIPQEARLSLAGDRTVDVELSPTEAHVVAIWRETGELLERERNRRARAEHDHALWKRIFEDAPAQVSVLEGPELRYAFVSAAWRTAFGDRDVLGKTPAQVFPEYEGTDLQEALVVAYESGRRITLTEQPVVLPRPDGTREERFMTFSVRPYREVDGTVAGVLIFTLDVTEQARSRQRLEAVLVERDRLVAELEAEQRRAADMFRRNMIGTISWNLDGRILDANDVFLDCIGYTREDLAAGKVDWQKLTPPEFVDGDAIHVKSLLERGMHDPYEKEYVRKDGSRVPVLLSAAFFEGSTREGLSYVVDLSVVKRAAAAVRASEQRFRTLVEAISQTVWTTDPRGAVVAPSPSWTAFTGQSEEERAAFGWLDAVHPDDRESTRARWTAAVAERRACDLECRLRRSDGSYAITELKALPIFDDAGTLREWVGANTDVTAQRSAAAERERLREAAEAASRAKDEFLGTLSHELRTPLNAIIGWTALLRGGLVAADQRDHTLEVIERNARAQARLVEDLLDFSRIARTRLAVDRRPVDIGAVVRATLDTLRPSAHAKKVELVERVSPDVDRVRVSGDADRLHQVVTNLVANALKFTPTGGRVTVGVACKEQDVVLAVSDNGAGIAPEFLPHVFEPFRQADSSTSRATTGLGIGLGIVRTIVELHGGRVTAESPGLGRGATFTVTLPAFAMAGANDGHPAPGRGRDRTALGGVRVLVVDDDEDARALLELLLEGYGARVQTAAGATEALDLLARTTFDVLLSDVAMPGEDGYSLIRKVRDRGATIPAIAVTAFARTEDRANALGAGYDAHLAKPVDAGALVLAITALLRPADGT
jgi:PAS domain S-box-containing protein